MKAGCKLHTSVVAHDLPWGSDSCRVSALGGGGADETLSQHCSVQDDTNVHCHSVRNRDPWNQSDDDETSILLLEENKVRRVPFPSTVSGTFGLLKGKVMRDIHIQKPNQDNQCVFRVHESNLSWPKSGSQVFPPMATMKHLSPYSRLRLFEGRPDILLW